MLSGLAVRQFGTTMTLDHRLRRLKFRAHHRGTKEADILVGGYFDRHSPAWGEAECDWFERLCEVEDVEIMGWAFGSIEAPTDWHGPQLTALQALDYIAVAR